MVRKAGRLGIPLVVALAFSLFLWHSTQEHHGGASEAGFETHLELQDTMRYPPPKPPPRLSPSDDRPSKTSFDILMDRKHTLTALEDLLQPMSSSEISRDVTAHNRKVFARVVECASTGACTQFQAKGKLETFVQ